MSVQISRIRSVSIISHRKISNWASQILKCKYVAYLSVLSQISNCQGLGRKNKHEMLKTDHIPVCAGTDNLTNAGGRAKLWYSHPSLGHIQSPARNAMASTSGRMAQNQMSLPALRWPTRLEPGGRRPHSPNIGHVIIACLLV